MSYKMEDDPMTVDDIMSAKNAGLTDVKLVNEHFCLIAMPYEVVHSILSAAGGTIADPSIFGKEHREEAHKQLNDVISNIIPTYTFIDN